MGIIGKLIDKISSKKDKQESTRLGEHKPRETPIQREEEFMPRYKLAQKWREEQANKEPLVKRAEFKRKI